MLLLKGMFMENGSGGLMGGRKISIYFQSLAKSGYIPFSMVETLVPGLEINSILIS